jgi:predicted urease superfamily metal-dependent hydrolase
MDYLSIQQHKEALDERISRAIAEFERMTGIQVRELVVHHLTGTLVSTGVTSHLHRGA